MKKSMYRKGDGSNVKDGGNNMGWVGGSANEWVGE